MNDMYDLAIVGGGVLGSFHAYHAMKKGLKVALFEKDRAPLGATVRNFGQVVPSGMNTKWQAYGRESLKIYKEIQSEMDISVKQQGTVYLASNNEELQLLEELALINKHNAYESRMLTKKECLDKYPGLREDYVMAGLFFPEEINIAPRTMINRLHSYLKACGLHLFVNSKVLGCDTLKNQVSVYTAAGYMYSAAKVLICNGSDFKTLYPELFNASDMEVAKLQMMQTKPQTGYKLKGSILTGLSIRRYEAFAECPSYELIKSKEPEESKSKKWGVHVLFKQAEDRSVILGDSHEYADVASADSLGFDMDMDIDKFIIDEARKIIDLPNYEIQNRWIGMYSQCKNSDIYQNTVDQNIHIITGIGGKGMTGSAGYAKKNIDSIFNFTQYA